MFGTRLTMGWALATFLRYWPRDHTPGTPVHYPWTSELYVPPLQPLLGASGPASLYVHLSSSSVQSACTSPSTSINQLNVHISVKCPYFSKTQLFEIFDTAVWLEWRHVVRFMRVRTPETRRLDLRPETCPPQEQPHSQDPGYVRNMVLFLGLFDVTRSRRVADGTCVWAWDGIWHCFDLFSWLYYPGCSVIQVLNSVKQVLNEVNSGYQSEKPHQYMDLLGN